jgi:glycosyltransferase involved in cell wall biosynthesis
MISRVDQALHTFAGGDAISDDALFLRGAIRRMGFESEIFAHSIGDSVASEARLFAEWVPAIDDAVIHHYAIASHVAGRVSRMKNRRALVYHNVTPEAYFRPFDPAYADLLEASRVELRKLAPLFDMAIADSHFNARDFEVLTGRPAEVVPISVDPQRFGRPSDRAEMHPRGSSATWLAVGRVVPNKGLLRLIDAFAAYVELDAGARLAIVGRYTVDDPYYASLRERVAAHALDGRVLFTGGVTAEELTAWFSSSDVYVSLSEHEGFCVPLVEAMWFDLPIVAAASTAIPETLGSAGLLVEESATPGEIAGLVAILLRDAVLRDRVIAEQQERRCFFVPAAVEPLVADVVRRLIA